MTQLELIAEPRVDQGKGASRRLRRNGKIPAVLYGASQEPLSIQLSNNELTHQSEQEAFYSQILSLDLNGAKEPVVVKDMQRHPFKWQILHLDLMRIDEDETLTMRVPIHFVNEDKCIGVKLEGGVISHLMNEIEVVCMPKDLPEYIELDVAELDIGETIHIGDLSVPEGVQIAALMHQGDPAQPVVSVQAPRVAEEEIEMAELGEEELPAEGEAAEGEEPAEDAGKEEDA